MSQLWAIYNSDNFCLFLGLSPSGSLSIGVQSQSFQNDSNNYQSSISLHCETLSGDHFSTVLKCINIFEVFRYLQWNWRRICWGWHWNRVSNPKSSYIHTNGEKIWTTPVSIYPRGGKYKRLEILHFLHPKYWSS